MFSTDVVCHVAIVSSMVIIVQIYYFAYIDHDLGEEKKPKFSFFLIGLYYFETNARHGLVSKLVNEFCVNLQKLKKKTFNANIHDLIPCNK
jgi:hypothetical protein